MPPKNLDPLKDLARAGLRASEYQVLLYLAAAGEAGLEEVMEELGFKRAWAYRALSPLVRRGLVEKEGSRYRLSPPLEDLFSPLRQTQEASPSEEKPKRAGGKRPKPESPVAALAQAHPHLKGLLHFAGQTVPKVAQPLAAKAPGVLVGAALAARKYGRGQEASVLVSWLPDVKAWVEAWGAEAVEGALTEATKKADKPFPYARKLLLARPEEAPEVPEEEMGYF
jgi:hypothetical protein